MPEEYLELIECLKSMADEFNLAKKSIRKIALDYAWKFIGTFYSWGGDDPGGFDCSGFICEVLSAVGILPRAADYTAAYMAELFKDKQVGMPYAGCLVFYADKEDATKVVHIELCINETLSIGASGGGSKTITKEDAIRDNAFIKVRPFQSRSNIYGYADPFKEIPK